MNGEPVTSLSASLAVGYTTTSGPNLGPNAQITGAGNQRCETPTGTYSVPFGPTMRLMKLAKAASGSFDFTTTNLDQPGFALDATIPSGADFVSDYQTLYFPSSLYNSGTQTYPAGTLITVTENLATPDWTLEGITCSDPSGMVGTFDSGSATLTIDSGELSNNQFITCMATNQANGELVVRKSVSAPAGLSVPSADAWSMGYTDGGSTSDAQTGTATTPLTAALPAGTYQLTEQLASNVGAAARAYDVSVSCTGTGVRFTSASTTVAGGGLVTLGSVTVPAGGTADCTVTNTRRRRR